jgi:hypothetical protein
VGVSECVGDEREDGEDGEEGIVRVPEEEEAEEAEAEAEAEAEIPRGLCGTSAFVSVDEVTTVEDEDKLEELLEPQNNNFSSYILRWIK